MNDTRANQWVPVSEQLPRQGCFYLVSRNGNYQIGYYDGSEWSRDGTFIHSVTHWMDLPEPPTPPKPADPFEAWWEPNKGRLAYHTTIARSAWNAAKAHYAKPKDYTLGYEDAIIAFESMVNRILEGKDDGTCTLGIPQLEKLRRVLLERLKPRPDFETWAKAHCADGPYLAVYWHPITKQLIHIDNARGIWNAAQGKP